jgi:hypothetical protein
MKSHFLIRVILIFIKVATFFFWSQTYSQSTNDYRTFQNGDWNQTATWQRYNGANWVSATAAPSSSDGVISIRNGHTVSVTATVTIDQTTVDLGGKVILSGGTLTIANGTGTDLVIEGTYERTSSSTTMSINSGATVECAGGGSYIHNVAGGSIPTITWSNNSLFNIKQSVTSNLNQSFWNVIIEGGNATTLSADNTSRTMTVRNNFTLVKGNYYLKTGSPDGGTHSIRVQGNFFHSGGGFYWNNNSTDNTSITNIFVEKDFVISDSATWGGFVSATQCASGVFFDGNGSQTFSTILSGGSGALRDRFYYKSSGGPTALNEIYNGSLAQQYTINGTCSPSPPTGYSRWPTSGSLVRQFTVNNPNGLEIRDNREINDTLFRTRGSLSGSGVIIYQSNATLVYNGSLSIQTGDKEFPATSGPSNLIIDNIGGVILHSNRSLSASLRLKKGLLKTSTCNASTTGTNRLVLNSNATVTEASDISFVDGVLLKVGNTAFEFPVGHGDSTEYAPVGISAPIQITDTFAACYLNRNPQTTFDTTKEVSLHHISECEYWHVNKLSGSSSVNVVLKWGERSCGVTNIADLRVAKWDGTEWKDMGNIASTGNTLEGKVTSQSVNSFSPFTLASASISNPLPVDFLYFTGFYAIGYNKLEWATSLEIDNDFFQIERSVDGVNFEIIGFKKGQGFSTAQTSYSFEDFSISAQYYYYRLKQVDIDGKYDYSNIIFISSNTSDVISFSPNPAKTLLNIYGLNSDNFIEIYNPQGVKIIEKNIDSKGLLDISHFENGIYILKIEDKRFKIVVEK